MAAEADDSSFMWATYLLHNISLDFFGFTIEKVEKAHIFREIQDRHSESKLAQR